MMKAFASLTFLGDERLIGMLQIPKLIIGCGFAMPRQERHIFFAKTWDFGDFEYASMLICSKKAVLSMIFSMKIVAMYGPP